MSTGALRSPRHRLRPATGRASRRALRARQTPEGLPGRYKKAPLLRIHRLVTTCGLGGRPSGAACRRKTPRVRGLHPSSRSGWEKQPLCGWTRAVRRRPRGDLGPFFRTDFLRPAWTRGSQHEVSGPIGVGVKLSVLDRRGGAGDAARCSSAPELVTARPDHTPQGVWPPVNAAGGETSGGAAGWSVRPPSCSRTVVIAEIDGRRRAVRRPRRKLRAPWRQGRWKPARRRKRWERGGGFPGNSRQRAACPRGAWSYRRSARADRGGAPVDGRRFGSWEGAARADPSCTAEGAAQAVPTAERTLCSLTGARLERSWPSADLPRAGRTRGDMERQRSSFERCERPNKPPQGSAGRYGAPLPRDGESGPKR